MRINLLRTILPRHQVRGKCTNNVDSYHLTVGSAAPRISKDQDAVSLVNMRFCPYAQRTVMCLNAKNVDYHIINCQLMSKVLLMKVVFENNLIISQNGCGT